MASNNDEENGETNAATHDAERVELTRVIGDIQTQIKELREWQAQTSKNQFQSDGSAAELTRLVRELAMAQRGTLPKEAETTQRTARREANSDRRKSQDRRNRSAEGENPEAKTKQEAPPARRRF